jgi:type II secretion system protein J
MKTALHSTAGFTLIEIMVASVIGVLILAAVYGIFFRAMKMRDNATERMRAARLRARAVNVIRNDLRNALVSGGILANTLQGDSNNTDRDANFPGYLKLTTTTGKDTADEMYGDVQQVEYYVVKDPEATGTDSGGTLVRIVTRDLLNSDPQVQHEEQILTGVNSFQVAFYDGSTWQQAWQISGTSSQSGTSTVTSGTSTTSGTSATVTLPEAVRIDIQQSGTDTATSSAALKPVPIEIVMPWATAPFLSGSNFVIGSGTTAAAQSGSTSL